MSLLSNSAVITVDEIQTLIPHRFPMLLLDKLIDVNAPESGTGVKNVTINEWFFQGHFPQRPIMPGVLIVEAMAQTAGVLVVKAMQPREKNKKLVYFMTIDQARFRKPVVPGDVLYMNVKKQRARSNVWKFKGIATVGDQVVAESVFSAMITH